MVSHGMIGVVRTLEFLGRISPGQVAVDTPVGTVYADLRDDHQVTIENVPSRCTQRDVNVTVPGLGNITGDVAYGGAAHITAEATLHLNSDDPYRFGIAET